ncbi:hypothetical protein YC2023_089888 [Brassica napus]
MRKKKLSQKRVRALKVMMLPANNAATNNYDRKTDYYSSSENINVIGFRSKPSILDHFITVITGKTSPIKHINSISNRNKKTRSEQIQEACDYKP